MSELIQRVAEQIHHQAKSIAQPAEFLATGKQATENNQSAFSGFLINSINEINSTQLTAKHQSEAWMSGRSDIGLHDVMLSVQKSSLAFSFAVQMRNKMLSAYQEVMNMPV